MQSENSIPPNLSMTTSQLRVKLALEAIQHSLAVRIDVQRIAEQLRVSRRQLERDFRRWLGVGLFEYARRRRFELAAEALRAGTPILQVAMTYGYADQSHLTHTTRRMMGCTPGVLRATRQADEMQALVAAA
jgi:transcriptional regulator GlxA family with amidase domain